MNIELHKIHFKHKYVDSCVQLYFNFSNLSKKFPIKYSSKLI